jgi:4-amino-4-deoxy-L-arabinose transferase-like glycosyltransferase
MSSKNNKQDTSFLPTLGICFGILLLIFFEPLSYDNAIYQQMAREIYQYHRLPYVATWDQNFPGIIYLHYLAIRLFGLADTSVRIIDILLQLGFCAVLYKLCRVWLAEHTAAIATVLYASFFVAGGQSVYFERDGYAMMCCITAFYLLVREYHHSSFRNSNFLLAAFLCGYAVLLKPTAALYVTPIAVFILLKESERYGMKKRIFRLAAFSIVAAIPIALVLLFYMGLPGGLRALYLATIRYNLDIYAGGRSGIREIAINLLRTAFLFPFAAYGAWLIYRRKEKRFFRLLSPRISSWYYFIALAATFITVVVQGKFWQYQWTPFCIVIIPLVAIAVESISGRIREPVTRHYTVVGCIILCSFIQMNPKSQSSILFDITHRQPLFGDTYDFASLKPDYGVKAERATLRYLDSIGVKDREVEICSIEPHLRLHFRHEALGAFGLLYPISQRPIGSTHNIPFTSYQREWQHGYFDTLRLNQPRFIVISLASDYLGVDTILHLIPGFDRFFSMYYFHDTAFGTYEIYQHR